MKFLVAFLALFNLASVAIALNKRSPTVGSIDNSACVGGIITEASTFKSSKGEDVFMKRIACPSGSESPSLKSTTSTAANPGKILPRQSTCGSLDGCNLNCNVGLGLAFVTDCEDLALAVVEDSSIEDPIVVSGFGAIGFELGTCSFLFENNFDAESVICKVDFGGIGEGISEDCQPDGTGECFSNAGGYTFLTASS